MRRALLAACVTSALLAASALPPAQAADEIKTTIVLSAELEGGDGQEAHVIRVEVPPGWETERHIHPGHVFVYVIDGAIEIDIEGEEPQTVSAGEAAYELPDKAIIGRNASADQGAKLVACQVGPVGAPLMVVLPK